MSENDRQLEAGANSPATGRQKRQRQRRTILLITVLVWGICVSTGMYSLWGYANVAGTKQAPPKNWPTQSQIKISGGQPALLVFAHPKCPCTRASIRELERLVARVQGVVETFVIFTEPAELGDDWCWTDLRESATAIPGVQVVHDQAGVESEIFNARTSGLALLYSDSGQLLFEGGITASRGHEGDNDGVSALESIILNSGSPICQTPVYGCPLQSPDFVEKWNPQK